MQKLKISFFWLASCGGCEIALLDIDEVILDLAAIADIVFMPLAVDGKWSDIQAMEDEEIDISFINGSVRSTDHLHELDLLRKKSKLIISFGQCSVSGGIIGLGNTFNPDTLLEFAYNLSPSTYNPDPDNPMQNTPQTEFIDPAGITLTLPALLENVGSIDQFIDVDYYIPGCPPPVPVIVQAINAIKMNDLPPKGSYIGSNKSVCDECSRSKNERKNITIKKFKRPDEISFKGNSDQSCLIEEGLICMGPVTRGACDAACPSVNMPCRGCHGLTPDTRDPAAKMISVLSQFSAHMTKKEVTTLVDSIIDPVGTFYRFSFPKSLIKHNLYKEV